MPAYRPKSAAVLLGNRIAIARFIHTSIGNASKRCNPYKAAHSATFGPTPCIVINCWRTSSSGIVFIASNIIIPWATFCAAFNIYFARNPLRSGAKSSTVQFARTSGAGNAKPPGIFSPKCSHKRDTIPLIRGMLLFCEIIKQHSASQGSCCKIRIPGAYCAALHKIGSSSDKSSLIDL